MALRAYHDQSKNLVAERSALNGFPAIRRRREKAVRSESARGFLLLGLLLALTFILAGVGGTTAFAAPSSAPSVPTVTGPILLANGMLRYDVTFPEGQGYGAVLAALNKDGSVTARFFGNKQEYEAARGPAGPDSFGSGAGPKMGQSTAEISAPSASTTPDSGRSTATLHQRRVEATALIEDVVYIDMNKAQSKETYTYAGINVTAATAWGSSWWNTDTGWVRLYGPILNIGSVPASNVLLTNLTHMAPVGDGTGEESTLSSIYTE